MRPRLDYMDGLYFTESYRIEIKCMQTHYKLIKEIVDYQM